MVPEPSPRLTGFSHVAGLEPCALVAPILEGVTVAVASFAGRVVIPLGTGSYSNGSVIEASSAETFVASVVCALADADVDAVLLPPVLLDLSNIRRPVVRTGEPKLTLGILLFLTPVDLLLVLP